MNRDWGFQAPKKTEAPYKWHKSGPYDSCVILKVLRSCTALCVEEQIESNVAHKPFEPLL